MGEDRLGDRKVRFLGEMVKLEAGGDYELGPLRFVDTPLKFLGEPRGDEFFLLFQSLVIAGVQILDEEPACPQTAAAHVEEAVRSPQPAFDEEVELQLPHLIPEPLAADVVPVA